MWNLFEERPLLVHFYDWDVLVAAVSPIDKGIVWWSADFLIGLELSGIPGSGFPDHPWFGQEKYDSDSNTWEVAERRHRLVDRNRLIFSLPTSELLEQWEMYKQHVPSLAELHKRAIDFYGGRT